MKTAKPFVLTLLLAAMAFSTQAQESSKFHLPDYDNQTFHFGFLLGFNEMTYALNTVKDYQNIAQSAYSWPYEYYNPHNTRCLYVQNIESIPTPGFTLGVTSNLRLGKHFSLRFIPSMSFGERRMHYSIGVEDFEGDINTIDLTKSIQTTFVEFPINLKYRIIRYNNIGPYLMCGINSRIDLSGYRRPSWMTGDESFYSTLVPKPYDYAAEFGVGLDIYNKQFKLSVEFKMSEGLRDIVKGDALIYTAPVEQLRNRIFQFSLLFE